VRGSGIGTAYAHRMAMTPGWYPDPFSSAGYVRWWDGERWGASVLLPEGTPPPVPGEPVDLPPPGSAPHPQASKYAPPAGSSAGYPPPPAGGAPPQAPPFGAPYAGGYGAPAASAQAPYELASYGSRVAARIIDTLIVTVVLIPFYVWLLWPALQRFMDSLPEDGTLPDSALQQWITDVTGLSLLLTLISLVVTFLYEVPQNVRWGMTLGKRLLGIRIRLRDQDGDGLAWGTATIRWGVEGFGAALIGGLFTLIDYLWPLWDKPWRQTLHDKVARTTVVPRRR
jgi:uncharacterized RDD family membrane protein YckC